MMKRWLGSLCAVCFRHAAWRTGLVLWLGVLCAAVVVRADDATLAEDKAELQMLKARLEKLEEKVAGQEAAQAGAEGGNAIIQLPSGLHGVQMSGHVDTTATYNFNAPQTRTNTLRVFDTRANSVMLNSAELIIKKPVSAESPVGLRTDLAFGTDSEVVGSVTTGLGTGDDELDIQQAFVEYLAPIGNGLDVQVGKFVTLHGAEVIKSKDDWNISRSYLFGFAIPFTHTGIRASYPWSERLTTIVGVNNGWDVVDDNNQAKTIELGFASMPIDKVSLGSTFMFGAEQAGNNNNGRTLIDIVAGWQPIEPLQLKVNYDYGWEDDAVAFGNNAVWHGLAAYARYAFTDKLALVGRGEYFNDADGVRTAILSPGINGITGSGVKLYEYTLTTEYQIYKNLIGRLEYRHDQASEKVFRNRDLSQRSYQDTVALEFIAPF